MFIVIRSKTVERYEKGYTAMVCPRCKKVQAFVCEEAYQSKSLYFIEYDNSKIGELITCDFCGTCYATKQDLGIDIDGFWKPSEGLQKLVDKTNPELGQIPAQQGHTDDELLALLLSLKDESSVFKKDVTPGIFLGGLAGIAIDVLLVVTRILHEAPNDNLVYVLVPPGILSVAGALWWGAREMRKLILGSLKYSIRRHKIDKTKLLRVSQANAEKLGAVPRAVALLAM